MKKFLTYFLAAVAAVIFFNGMRMVAKAGSCTTSKVGSFEYTNCDNGYSSTTSKVGNYKYTNDNQGGHCTTSKVGNYEYTNCY